MGFGDEGLGFRVWVLGCRVRLGVRVEGLRFRISGLGCRV